jgi:hypothetical protein
MIDITTLPPIVQTELRNDPFIFVAANGDEVNVKHLSAIVRGDKLTHVIDVLPRHKYPSGYHPFFLQHTNLFSKAQELFKSLFGLEPDMLIYSYKTDFTSSIFLFANKSLVDQALKKEDIEIKWDGIGDEIKGYEILLKKEEKKGISAKNVNIKDNIIDVKLPTGVFPVIGALNSVDSGWRTPNFNLIFGTEYLVNLDETKNSSVININIDNDEKKNHAEEPEWVSNIDEYLLSRFKYGMSLYSIDKFDFKYDNDLCQFYNPFNSPIFYDNAVSKSKIKFINTLISFLLAINRGACLPISKEQFSSFMPHFYEFDRLVESVAEYDVSEKRKLKRYYDTALNFSAGVNFLTCKNFIDYFLRDSIINFKMLRIDPAKEILKAFEKQPQIPLLIGARKEILSRFITNGLPNPRYDRFLNGPDGQVEGKTKVYPLL